LSGELRERFLQYEWPGNVRELENMIKRFVILQDEQLVVRELSKPRAASVMGAHPAASELPPLFQSPPHTAPAPMPTAMTTMRM
jgi:two-component system response regulator AtoC